MFSILFNRKMDLMEREPDFFEDLNLGPVIQAINAPLKDLNLKPYYYTMLQTKEDIQYRLDVFNDLKQDTLRIKIAAFVNRFNHIVKQYHKINSMSHVSHVERSILLDLIRDYIFLIEELIRELDSLKFTSQGIKNLYSFMVNIFKSDYLKTLQEDLNRLDEKMSTIQFDLLLNEGYIYVLKPLKNLTNFPQEINEKFKKIITIDDTLDLQVKEKSLAGGIKKDMLDKLASLYKEEFRELELFYKKYSTFISEELIQFGSEYHFYLVYCAYMEKIKTLGLKFTNPNVNTDKKEIEIFDTFDIALAQSFLYTGNTIITNDFYLKNPERTIVISGPNQGGKTTFARTFGQLAYLASIGVPVPGTKALLYAPDQIFTHFEVEESILKADGKLNQELIRLKDIMSQATSRSMIILNEVFSSTSIADGVVLGKKILDIIKEKDCVSVFVTFLDELSKYNETTVSMVSTIIPETPEIRTLKILRKEADGLAYADAIAKKYSLDYEDVKRRLQYES